MTMNHRTLGLDVSWATSRGRETYGWNICRLDALVPKADGYGFERKRYRTMGGGYDMVGTVLADWLCDQFQDRLAKVPPDTYGVRHYHYYQSPDRVGIDGAIGSQAVISIAALAGIEIEPQYNTRGTLTYFLVRVPVDDPTSEQSTE